MTSEVELIGFDELARALEGADELFKPLATKAIALSLSAIEERISPYPPQPSRTRAKTFNTYVRGQGHYPKSAFVADSGEPGGFRTKRIPKGKIRMTSQQMDKSFKQTVAMTKTGIDGELRNDASYSGYVLGEKNQNADPHQVVYHTQTGWVSTDDAISQATPDIENSINDAVNELLKKMAGH